MVHLVCTFVYGTLSVYLQTGTFQCVWYKVLNKLIKEIVLYEVKDVNKLILKKFKNQKKKNIGKKKKKQCLQSIIK